MSADARDQRAGAVAVLVQRPVTADGSGLARPCGDRELPRLSRNVGCGTGSSTTAVTPGRAKHVAWLRHEALAQLTSHATRLTFDSDYETVLAAKARQRVGFAVCLALVLLMLPVVVPVH